MVLVLCSVGEQGRAASTRLVAKESLSRSTAASGMPDLPYLTFAIEIIGTASASRRFVRSPSPFSSTPTLPSWHLFRTVEKPISLCPFRVPRSARFLIGSPLPACRVPLVILRRLPLAFVVVRPAESTVEKLNAHDTTPQRAQRHITTAHLHITSLPDNLLHWRLLPHWTDTLQPPFLVFFE